MLFFNFIVLLMPVPADNNNFPVNQLKDITGNTHRLKNGNAVHQARLIIISDLLTDVNPI